MIVLLRAVNWGSLALVLIWSWYYLGSQAAGREYVYKTSGSFKKNSLVLFANPNSSSLFQGPQITNAQLANINGHWISAYTYFGNTPDAKKAGADISGSAVTPIYDPSIFAGMKPDKYGWYDAGADVPDYHPSSCLGTTIWGTDTYPLDPTSRNAATNWLGSYVQSTFYIHANCDPVLRNSALSDFPNGALPEMPVALNTSSSTAVGYPRVILWARNSNYSSRVSCNLEMHLVHIQALCNADACITKSMKPTSVNYIRPATVFNNATFAQIFFDNMLLAAGRPDSIIDKDGTIITQPLHGAFFDENDNPQPGEDLPVGSQFNQTNNFLSLTLTMYINSYMQVSQPLTNGTTIPVLDLFDLKNRNASIIEHNNPIFIVEGDKLVNLIMIGTQELENWPFALGNGAIYNPRYVLDPIWIAIDMMTCLILVCAATLSIWLRLNTVAPDIFGYISSMTRDNPHMRLPDGGSTMPGPERARALGKIKVKIADLGGHSQVGHIGLAAVHPDVELGNVEERKVYT